MLKANIRIKILGRYLLVFFVTSMLALTLASNALSRPFRMEKLPDKGKNFSCKTCHVGFGGDRNPFGKDYEDIGIKADDQYTEELAKKDSDGDGFTNAEEFAANTNTGDPNSKPERKEVKQEQKINVEAKKDSAIKDEKKADVPEKQTTIAKTQETKPQKDELPIKEPAAQSKAVEPDKMIVPELKSDDTPLEEQMIIPPTKNKPINYKSDIYKAGRYIALVGFFLIFVQYILSSKIKFIESKFGLDKLFIVHRKIGVIGLILVLIHPTLLFIVFGIEGYSLLWKGVGAIALIILILIAGAAILYAKLHLKYETWKNIHRASYAILPIAFIHSMVLGSDLNGLLWLKILWFILAGIYVLVMIYKILSWANVRKHPFKITDAIQETHDVWSLHFDGTKKDYKPGQFMIINLKRNGKVSESHPFTISSSPTSGNLSISVKSSGDFTATIKDTKTSDIAFIDAPYGRFSFLNHDNDNLVFIAGGIGITPFISMLRYIRDKKLNRNVTLIWANKTEDDIAFRAELEKMTSEMPSLKVIHVMSKQDDWQGEKGYVDAEKIKGLVENVSGSEFFICGPPIMMTLVEKDLIGLGVSKSRIHYERFALR